MLKVYQLNEIDSMLLINVPKADLYSYFYMQIPQDNLKDQDEMPHFQYMHEVIE